MRIVIVIHNICRATTVNNVVHRPKSTLCKKQQELLPDATPLAARHRMVLIRTQIVGSAGFVAGVVQVGFLALGGRGGGVRVRVGLVLIFLVGFGSVTGR